MEVWMPMRTEPSIHAGGPGSGSGSGRYSSSGSNSITLGRGCSGIPNENSAPCLIHYSNTGGENPGLSVVNLGGGGGPVKGAAEPPPAKNCAPTGHGADKTFPLLR